MIPSTFLQKTLLLFLSLLLGSLSGQGAEIQFRSQADVPGSLVLLGDIAEIRAASPAEAESLRRIELFPSPSVGKSRVAKVTEIRQLLRLHGVASPADQFSGPAAVRITNRALKTNRPPAKGDSSEESEDTAQVEVVYARRTIAQGDIVREIDVELKTIDKLPEGAQFARSLEQIVGWETTRQVASGQPLDLRFLRKPVLVARGQAISVMAKFAGVKAKTTARALEAGTLGDVIMLESLETKQRYSAVVTGSQQAEVFAGGVTVSDPVRNNASTPPMAKKKQTRDASTVGELPRAQRDNSATADVKR